ncbi:MAG: glyoxalase/bleomycin resistance/dioxygenase family protein [Gammaproteobacteria bacterium]|nr:glyoxalase/bleomycin resistance/dioxygenase family protein [Gammaproteobacteria bacterium]
MKRFHVHVAVDNLAEGIRFYSTMFAVEPTVAKPDYAKWMLDDPRVNFAISQRGAEVGLDHLGIQVESADELAEMNARLQKLQTGVAEEVGTACCYAKSDKYWTADPSGIAWETFHTLDSIPVFGGAASQQMDCCGPQAKTETTSPCCVPVSISKTPSKSCC